MVLDTPETDKVRMSSYSGNLNDTREAGRLYVGIKAFMQRHNITSLDELELMYSYPDRLAEMRYMELQNKYNELLQKLRFIKDILHD